MGRLVLDEVENDPLRSALVLLILRIGTQSSPLFQAHFLHLA